MWTGWVHSSWRSGHAEALREVGPEMPERGFKTWSEQLLEFFWPCAIKMISCHNWGPRTKPGYITMTRRQNNNQWSVGISANPAPPQKITSAKIRWKSSPLDFLGSRRHPPHWSYSKGPNTQRGVLLISAGTTEGHFVGKDALGSSPNGSCSCTTMPRVSGHLQTKETGLPSDLDPSDYHLFSGLKKNNWKVVIFRPTRRSLVPRRPGWTDLLNFFWSGFRKLQQRAKKCIELRGEYVE